MSAFPGFQISRHMLDRCCIPDLEIKLFCAIDTSGPSRGVHPSATIACDQIFSIEGYFLRLNRRVKHRRAFESLVFVSSHKYRLTKSDFNTFIAKRLDRIKRDRQT